MPNGFSRVTNFPCGVRSGGGRRGTNRHLAFSTANVGGNEGLLADRHKSLATSYLGSVIALTFLIGSYFPFASAQQTKKPFTVTDDIGFAHFGGAFLGQEEEVLFSPDGSYFAVETESGRPDLNKVEDSLRFYRSKDVENFLKRSGASSPSPLWVVTRSTDKEGPIISKWRWVRDSSGVAYLERTSDGRYRLIFADLRKKTIEPLTSTTETVEDFDILDRQHYVYTGCDLSERQNPHAEDQAPAVVVTGRKLKEFLFPSDSTIVYYLWAVVGDEHFQVKHDGAPVVLGAVVPGDLALSPDGASLVAELPVLEVPPSWETLYPPLFPSDPFRIRASPGRGVHQYVRINLKTGYIQALTDAPGSNVAAGLWEAVLGGPSWSNDGKAIILPATFLKSKNNTPTRPCIAVVDLPSDTRTCVRILKGQTEAGAEEGFHHAKMVRFVGGDKRWVTVSFYQPGEWSSSSISTTKYQQETDDNWRLAAQFAGEPKVGQGAVDIAVRQDLNEPPVLIARNKETSRVVWDPNPQLGHIDLGQASVYTWKDKEGREWKAGLYKPSNYKTGQRYPLVIQTHGFNKAEFTPSGLLSTAFAARALAAAGIVVLQVSEHGCPSFAAEGPCTVSGYEAAANQLVSEGVVNPETIGIIGFSRTCFYVMEALTTGTLHFKAASITDGVMASYLQYMMRGGGSGLDREFDSMIGAPPFGEGLELWLKRSPGFNLDRISTPLMVVGEGPFSVLKMWEPYAGLRYLRKPVDLIMLNTDEHVLTNPAVRIASQGGSVDWFRFWLKGEEDADPAKKEQYARWRDLRKLQEENEKKLTTPGSASK